MKVFSPTQAACSTLGERAISHFDGQILAKDWCLPSFFSRNRLHAIALHYPEMSQALSNALPTRHPESTNPAGLEFNPVAPTQLFGPPSAGGLPYAAFVKVRLQPGQKIGDIATNFGSTAHDVGAASALPHYFIGPDHELIVPGVGLLKDPDFQAAASYYKGEYQKFEGRIERDESFDPAHIPDLPGARLTSSANYQNVIGPHGVSVETTHIDLKPSLAELRRQIAEAFNTYWQRETSPQQNMMAHLPGPAVRGGVAPGVREMAMKVGPKGMELIPARIEFDPDKVLRLKELAQQQTWQMHQPGQQDDMTLTQNRWGLAFSNNAVALYGAVSVGAHVLGDWKAQRWAEGKRVHNKHQAAMAGDRARQQGAVDHSSQIERAADFFNWLTGHLQQWAPTLLTMAPGAVAGGVALGSRVGARLGGVFTSYPLGVGSIYRAQHDQNGTFDAATALSLGALHAGVNYFGLEGALMGAQPFRNGLRMLDGLKGMGGGVVRAGTTGMKVAPKEGLTEGAQTITEQLGRISVNPWQTLFNPQSIDDVKESLYAGGAVGFVGGAGFGGWRRSGESAPQRTQVQSVVKVEQPSGFAAALRNLWPEGGLSAWTGGALHPTSLFGDSPAWRLINNHGGYSFVVPPGKISGNLPGADLHLVPDAQTPPDSRKEKVLSALMLSRSPTYQILLDRLYGMKYEEIAKLRNLSKTAVHKHMVRFVGKLGGTTPKQIPALLTGVFGSEQTAIGLAFALAHKYDEFVGKYLAHRPIPALKNVALFENTEYLDVLDNAINGFNYETQVIEMSKSQTEKKRRQQIYEAAGAYSLKDFMVRYPGGIKKLQADIVELRHYLSSKAAGDLRMERVIDFIFHLKPVSRNVIADYVDGKYKNGDGKRSEVSQIASAHGLEYGAAHAIITHASNKLDVSLDDLPEALSVALLGGEAGMGLLRLAANNFKEFARKIRNGAPIRQLADIEVTAFEMAVLNFYLNGNSGPQIAREFGKSRDYINDIKHSLLRKFNAWTVEELMHRYEGGLSQLKKDVDAWGIRDARPANLLVEALDDMVSEVGLDEGPRSGEWFPQGPEERVAAALMWSRTRVLEDLRDFVGGKSVADIALARGVYGNSIYNSFRSVVKIISGARVSDTVSANLESVRQLLSGVYYPGQSASELMDDVVDRFDNFVDKHFNGRPITLLKDANLSDRQLLLLRDALNDTVTASTMLRVSASGKWVTSSVETLAEILRAFNALSFSDLSRRYPGNLSKLSEELDLMLGAGRISSEDLDSILHASADQIHDLLVRDLGVSPFAPVDLDFEKFPIRKQIVEVLMGKSSRFYDGLFDLINEASLAEVARREGVSASAMANVYNRLARDMFAESDNPKYQNLKAVNLKDALADALGSEENAHNFVVGLVHHFDEFAELYVSYRPVRGVGDIQLSADQIGWLKESLLQPEHSWTFQIRLLDEIVERFNAFSYYDLLRRYPGGESQLRIDLGLPPLTETRSSI